VRELRAAVNERVLARLDFEVQPVELVAAARGVGLPRALDVARALEARDEVVGRDVLARAELLRRGVEPGAACEDLAAEQAVNAFGEDRVVVAEHDGREEEEGDGGDDGRGADEAAPPAAPEALGRLLEPDDARRAHVRGGRDDIFRRMTQSHR
jgi:hypothetical protein